ncbi:alpha/beta hydrolase [Paenibacillus sp. CFBP 13594]|uniref:alpha/beta hydrolase n=1 Tax=Paenibacillus sp. CFBP 13594 TaxID=2774037 RepID=UPI00177E58F2|nr:alpha/beta hydrolase [Paenibacillus sp. CFBP 13594]MBD8838564.1 alpha/beta hydrolase [Paenibacillus sp. CFBP 13594]
METKRTGAKGFKRKRYWIPSVVLILIIGFIGIGTQWTPKITVFLLKSLIETANPDMNNKDTMLSDGITRVADVLYADEGRNDSTLDIYYPSVTSEPLPVVLWVHGGGWVLGDKADIAEYAVQLAKQGYVVVSMNYALAPDTTYPTPVIQTNQALMYVKNHVSEYQGDPDNIFLAGNSAGAQIASQTAAVVTNPSLAKLMNITRVAQPDDLRGVLLFCGPYNLSTVAETGFPLIRTFLWSYTGVKTFEDYPRLNEMSTVLQVTAAYPPAFITSGNVDPLTSQSIELAQVLKRLDVDTETLFFSNSSEKLGHDYQFDLESDAGQQAIHSAVRFMQQYSR